MNERARVRAEVRAELVGPDGFFETTEEIVRGWPVEVFANRARSVRDMVVNTCLLYTSDAADDDTIV